MVEKLGVALKQTCIHTLRWPFVGVRGVKVTLEHGRQSPGRRGPWLPTSYEAASDLQAADAAQAPTPREEGRESSDFWESGWDIHTILLSHDITYHCS